MSNSGPCCALGPWAACFAFNCEQMTASAVYVRVYVPLGRERRGSSARVVTSSQLMRQVRPMQFTHARIYVCFCQTDHAQLARHFHRALGVGKAPTQPQHSTHLGVGVPAVACTLDITMPLLMPRPITAGHRRRLQAVAGHHGPARGTGGWSAYTLRPGADCFPYIAVERVPTKYIIAPCYPSVTPGHAAAKPRALLSRPTCRR